MLEVIYLSIGFVITCGLIFFYTYITDSYSFNEFLCTMNMNVPKFIIYSILSIIFWPITLGLTIVIFSVLHILKLLIKALDSLIAKFRGKQR